MTKRITATNGELCPRCGRLDYNTVKDSRIFPEGRRRTRLCNGCGTRWQTTEIRVDLGVSVAEGIATIAGLETRLKGAMSALTALRDLLEWQRDVVQPVLELGSADAALKVGDGR